MKGNQQKKKIPERKCTGCAEHFPKSSLIRVVRSPEGVISLDASGKKISPSDIVAGDKVEIFYSGQVMLSYPPQVYAGKTRKL